MSMSSISEAESKAFVLSAIALSASLFDITFWFGVFGTVFFEHLFFVWVASTVALIASLFVPPIDALPAIVSWRGRIILLVPTLWLILEAMSNLTPTLHAAIGPLDWLIAVIAVGVSLPYLIYILVLVIVPDIDRLQHPKLRAALVSIAAMIAVCGFSIGQNHFVFLTCNDFKVAGDDIPDNCRMPERLRQPAD